MLNSWLKEISQKAKNAILTAFIYLSKSTRDYIYLLFGTQSPQTSTAQVSLSTFHFTWLAQEHFAHVTGITVKWLEKFSERINNWS